MPLSRRKSVLVLCLAVTKLAKKGLTPSQIGVVLRDSHGVAQVKSITGQKILRLLKKTGVFSTYLPLALPSACALHLVYAVSIAGLAPSLPEDLYHLIKKAVAVRKHLERNRNDKDSKFRLILIESRIHRISRYYKTARQLPPNWKYESATASTLVA
jgi:small subunit ribosomal protein S13e